MGFLPGGGCLVWSGGVSGPGCGVWSEGEADSPPPPGMATAAFDTHPTGTLLTTVNKQVLTNRFEASSVQCWDTNFCIYASKGPVIIRNQRFTITHSKIHVHTTFTPI